MESVVNVQNLSKTYGGKSVVHHVSFTIQKGEVVAILGPNGAGKTTTMKMILGLTPPTSGSATIFNTQSTQVKVKEKIGVMLQEIDLIDRLTVRELIELIRSYYSSPLSFERLVEIAGIRRETLKSMASKLSGGQKRRLGFALSLAGNPELLVLDEPTVGMDIHGRESFWEKIADLQKEGKTILFTTHYLQEADEFADRIILFQNGKVIADGKPNEIKSRIRFDAVSFLLKEQIPIDFLKTLPSVTDVYVQSERIYVVSKNTDDILRTIFEQNLPVHNIQIEKGSLDDAFKHLMLLEKEHLQ
ncbi:ABC transporter ATP-binding protein [Fervidibacillus halotolerans]|uniref:ABC transporter ATP-binding protein n=1 Tax=Fervidibacillus halotolerans TaxID=2980027 RepID=A0A9E8LYA9_9BACI|nr:ABC transporter ATP-binding protein [Fervidibacillus halotolerans]WAA11809.1 ABC transporter ATP-binding protein [Fervidibacillus halotolerans]